MKSLKTFLLFFCFAQLAIFCMCKNASDNKTTDNPAAESIPVSSLPNGTLNKETFLKAIGTLKSGEVLDTSILKNILPQKVVDLTMTSLTGKKTEQAGIMVATSEATYKKDNKALYVRIIDAGSNAGYLRSEAPWAGMQFQNTRADGYDKSMVVDGNNIRESYVTESKKAELTVIYDNRILLNLFGPNLTMEDLYMAIK